MTDSSHLRSGRDRGTRSSFQRRLCTRNRHPRSKRTVLLQHDTSVPGYEAVLVSVEIPVGGREGRHTHSGTAMIHVTDGAITLDYEGKPTTTYKAGRIASLWTPEKCTRGSTRRRCRPRRLLRS